jgi:hypothetical protein
MSASPSTKLQVNFKLADGTLVNIYADNVRELETSLTDISMVSALIKATSNDLGGASNISPNVAAIAQQFKATVIESAPPVYAPPAAPAQAGSGYTCKHGEMTFRQSKPGAPKAWKGYFCPTPQGTADQCEPKFLRG